METGWERGEIVPPPPPTSGMNEQRVLVMGRIRIVRAARLSAGRGKGYGGVDNKDDDSYAAWRRYAARTGHDGRGNQPTTASL